MDLPYAKFLFFLHAGHEIEVRLDELSEPPLDWVEREINQYHVEQLVHALTTDPRLLFHKAWIVVVDLTLEEFKLEGAKFLGSHVKKFLITGRHRRAALLKVCTYLNLNLEILQFVIVYLYSLYVFYYVNIHSV